MLISNEYRTCSISDPAVEQAVNEAKGQHLDPLDVLIEMEARANAVWLHARHDEPRQAFVAAYISIAIDNL